MTTNSETIPAKRLGFSVTDMTIGNVVRLQAEKWHDKTFLSFLEDGRAFSFREIHLRSNRLANGLRSFFPEKGVHVGILMENSPENLLLLMALGKIGAVAIPVNISARGDLLRYYIDHADCTVLVIDQSLTEHLKAVRDQLPKLRHVVVCQDQDFIVDPELDSSAAGLMSFPDEAVLCDIQFSDLALLLYTSGTTGPSKAIMFTHAYALSHAIDRAESYSFQPDDTVHVCLPLFHTSGLLTHTIGPFLAGASVALVKRFSASRFWPEVKSSGATVLGLLGSMANILWARPASEADRDHRARQAAIAPVPSAGLEFEERFGIKVAGTYGCSDYGLGAYRGIDEPFSKYFSAGKPRPAMHVRIVDETDLPVPAGEQGEIVMRCHYPWSTSPGYYKMPEQTIQSRRNEWFHTGDLGHLDPDGYLFFVGRKKDAIRRRGENISAYEVENAILKNDAIEDVAVFAVTANLGEDEVACAIILRPGAQVSESEIIRHCQDNLSYFMVPRYISFVSDLPRSPTQKVQKYLLRKHAEGNIANYWDRELHK